MKTCTKCKIEKPKTEYYKALLGKGGLSARCKGCIGESNRTCHKVYHPTKKCMRVCTKCKIEKQESEFHKRSRGKNGLNPECKSCRKIYADTRNSTIEMKKHHRKVALKRRYGITSDEYDNKLKAQAYACAICGTDKPGGIGRFHIDHSHETGNVRGLLCNKCNLFLGIIENEVFLLKTLKYLEGWKNE